MQHLYLAIGQGDFTIEVGHPELTGDLVLGEAYFLTIQGGKSYGYRPDSRVPRRCVHDFSWNSYTTCFQLLILFSCISKLDDQGSSPNQAYKEEAAPDAFRA